MKQRQPVENASTVTLTLSSLVPQQEEDLKETSMSACGGLDSRLKPAEMLSVVTLEEQFMLSNPPAWVR